eukprot:SAG11_NODE_4388_length_1918_cov_1.721825_1_plen_36_part_10
MGIGTTKGDTLQLKHHHPLYLMIGAMAPMVGLVAHL